MQRILPSKKRLSEDCAFGDFLQEMLRDQIVCGINNPRIQRCLTYKLAFELAQSMETADLICKLQLVLSRKPDKMNFTIHQEQLSHANHTTLPGIIVEEAIKLWIANIKTLSVIFVGRKAKYVAVCQLMQKLQGTGSSDSSPTLHQLTKRTLSPQKLTIWIQPQTKMNTFIYCDFMHKSTFNSFTFS